MMTDHAKRILQLVESGPPVLSILDLRQMTGYPTDAFDVAVVALLDARQVIGHCDRLVADALSTEHVEGVCYLTRVNR